MRQGSISNRDGFGIFEVLVVSVLLGTMSFFALQLYHTTTRNLASQVKRSDFMDILEQRVAVIRGVIKTGFGSPTQFLRAYASVLPSSPTEPVMYFNPQITVDPGPAAFAANLFGFASPETVPYQTTNIQVTYTIELKGTRFDAVSNKFVSFDINSTSGHRLADVSLIRIAAKADGQLALPNLKGEKEELIAIPQ